VKGIAAVDQNDLIASNLSSVKKSTSKADDAIATNTLAPAADVSISAEGLSMSLRVRKTGIQQTISDTLSDISTAEGTANGMLQYYDQLSGNDRYSMERDITRAVNYMWQSTTATHPLRNEWSQYGVITSSGKRIVTQGPKPLQQSMTSLFNDLRFDSKEAVQKSCGIIQEAHKMMIIYM